MASFPEMDGLAPRPYSANCAKTSVLPVMPAPTAALARTPAAAAGIAPGMVAARPEVTWPTAGSIASPPPAILMPVPNGTPIFTPKGTGCSPITCLAGIPAASRSKSLMLSIAWSVYGVETGVTEGVGERNLGGGDVVTVVGSTSRDEGPPGGLLKTREGSIS